MRAIKLFAGVFICLFLILGLAGCKKETIIQKVDVSQTFSKKWMIKLQEFEQYSSGTLITKKTDDYSNSGFYLDFHSDGTYAFYDLNGNVTGKWQLLADNYFVIDPGTIEERYYYILSLSDKYLIIRGPFTKNNTPKTSILFTGYYQRA